MSDSNSLIEALYIIPDDAKETTFCYDQQLPSLPLPDLSRTLDKYLESVRPFVTDAEFEKTRGLVTKFENGEARVLDEKLRRKAAAERNWLEKWWEDYAYLVCREPLIPYWSMDGVQPLNCFDWKYEGPEDQVSHASLFVYHLVHFWKLLRKERLRPTKSADGKTVFSMEQFRRLYNTNRLPGEKMDKVISHFKTEREGPCSSEFIVLCNGRIFAVESLNSNNEPLTPPELQHCFRQIADSSFDKTGKEVAVLSCDNRTNWAKNRSYLQMISQNNKNILSRIDQALFVVVLDKESPQTMSQISNANLCGDYNNRWPDKSQMLIYYRNGQSGNVCDHSCFDGIVSVTAHYYSFLRVEESNGQWNGSQLVGNVRQPTELVFDLDQNITNEIKRLQTDTQEQKHDVIMSRHCFSDYGKLAIQKFRLHPDAFLQMALQFAYYRMHGKPAPCYETATTRGYYNGRTETVRSCTNECITWIRSMLDDTCSNQERRVLLTKAIARHEQLMKEARDNAGCDRHLFGLYCTALEEGLEIPEIYEDPSYNKSGGGGNFVLSTSLVGYTPMGGGVAPMCLDGYGCFYNIEPKIINITVSIKSQSQVTSSDKFFQSLSQSLHLMKNMLEDSVNISKL